MTRRLLPAPRVPAVLAAALSGVLLLGACGGDDDDSASEDEAPATAAVPGSAGDEVALGEGDAGRGEQLAQDLGCRSCHQESDGLGPSWHGLFGSEVTLDDGSTVTADDAYLTLAIRDPGAQKVEGFDIAMPRYDDLDDDEVADLIAYIRSLV